CPRRSPLRRPPRRAPFPYTTLCRSAVGADGGGLDDQLDGLLDGHEVAGHVGMRHGDRAAGGDLGGERGEHRAAAAEDVAEADAQDRKSTRLNSSHVKSSYAVFCLKK